MNYQLFHGDCLEILPTLAAGSVDLIVTSPPYDNLRDYGKDFDAATFDWKSIIRELYRVTKTGGAVVWIVADATINGSETGTSFRQALWAMECGFNLHDTMIYQKAGVSFPDTNRYYQNFEYMFVFSKGQPQTTNLLNDRKNIWAGQKVHSTVRNANGTLTPKVCLGNITQENGVRYNVWRIPHNLPGRKDHPASFPESLAEDHILSWSNPGDVVFDPMMGSGTTGKMALLNGRRFVGSELDSGYFAIAKSRIEKAAQMADGQFVTKAGKAADTDGLPMFATEDVA